MVEVRLRVRGAASVPPRNFLASERRCRGCLQAQLLLPHKPGLPFFRDAHRQVAVKQNARLAEDANAAVGDRVEQGRAASLADPNCVRVKRKTRRLKNPSRLGAPISRSAAGDEFIHDGSSLDGRNARAKIEKTFNTENTEEHREKPRKSRGTIGPCFYCNFGHFTNHNSRVTNHSLEKPKAGESPVTTRESPVIASGHRWIAPCLACAGGRLPFLLQRFDQVAQRLDQLRAGDVALAELDAQLEGFVVGMVVEDERLRARAGARFFLALAAGFVASQSGLRDAVDRFLHLAFARLARDLQEQRLGHDANVLDAHLAQRFRGSRAGDIVSVTGTSAPWRFSWRCLRACIQTARHEALQAVRFLEWSQVFALKIFDQAASSSVPRRRPRFSRCTVLPASRRRATHGSGAHRR